MKNIPPPHIDHLKSSKPWHDYDAHMDGNHGHHSRDSLVSIEGILTDALVNVTCEYVTEK